MEINDEVVDELNNPDKENNRAVETMAQADATIDTKTAAVTEDSKEAKNENTVKQIVDFDYVVDNNPELSFKLNNLQKLGIGLDFIKELVALKSGFSIGDDIQVLEDGIDSVFKMLVVTISETPNGIVLNPDGTLDEELSIQQRIDIGTYDSREILGDKKENFGILKKEQVDDIRLETRQQILDQRISRSILNIQDLAKKNIREGYTDKQEEEINNIKNKTEDDQNKADSEADEGYIDSMDMLNLVDCARKFVKEKRGHNAYKPIREEFYNLLQKNKEAHPEIYKKFEQYGENIPNSAIENFFDDWCEKRNRTDIKLEFEDCDEILLIKTKAEFDNYDPEKKKTLMIHYLRGLQHLEDDLISKSIDAYNRKFEEFGITLSEDYIKTYLLQVYGINLDDKDTYKKVIESHDYTYNSDEKIENIREDLNNENNIDDNKPAYDKLKEKKGRHAIKSLGKNEIKDMLNSLMNDVSQEDFSTFEVLTLLKEYRDKNEKNRGGSKNPEKQKAALIAKTIEEYIIENQVKFKADFQQEYGIDIFNSEGTALDKKKIDEVLREGKAEHKQSSVFDTLREKIDILAKEAINQQEEAQKVQDLLNANKTDKRKSKIKEELINIDVFSLNDELVKKIRAYKDDDINNILDDKLRRAEEITNNILLYESRVSLLEGDDLDYQRVVKERDEFYSKNDKVKLKSQLFKNEDGTLNEYGKSKTQEYINKTVSNTISNYIDRTDYTKLTDIGKSNFERMILVGLSLPDISLRKRVSDKFREIYPEYFKDIPIEQTEEKIYKKVFGDVNQEELESRLEKNAKNVKKAILNNKAKNIEKINNQKKSDNINDNEFEDYFERNSIDLDIDKVNFQNLDNGFNIESKNIKFTDAEKSAYPELVKACMLGSWINDRNDTVKQLLLQMEFLNDFQKNREFVSNSVRSILENNKWFDKSQVYDDNGNVLPNAKAEAEKFREMYTFSENFTQIEEVINGNKTFSEFSDDEKKFVLFQATNLISLTNKIENKEQKSTIDKLAKMLLDKISDENRKFYNPKSNKIDKELIMKEYKQLDKSSNLKDIKDFKDFVNYTSAHSQNLRFNLRQYLWLKDTDYEDLSETNKLQQIVQKKQNFKSKIETAKLIKQSQKKLFYFEKDVSFLNEDQVKRINNKYIYAVYVSYLKRRGILDEQGANNKLSEFINDPADLNALLDEFVEKTKDEGAEISKAVGAKTYNLVTQYSTTSKKNKFFDENNMKLSYLGTTENDLIGEVFNFDRQTIDNLGDINISALWYHKQVRIEEILGHKDLAEKYRKDFEQNFNGKTITDVTTKIKNKVDEKCQELFFNNESSIETIKKSILGTSAYDFISNHRLLNKTIANLDAAEFNRTIDGYISKSSMDGKIGTLASTYRQLEEMSPKKEEANNLELVIQNYMLDRKELYGDYIENGRVNINKLLEADNGNEMSITNELLRVSKERKEFNENLRSKYEYVSERADKNMKGNERYQFYTNLKRLLEIDNKDKIIPDEIIDKINKRDPNAIKRAQLKIKQKKEDKWSDYGRNVAGTVVRGIKHLPAVITGKESKTEFASKVADKISGAFERFGEKIQATFGKEARKEWRAKLAERKEAALPAGNLDEKVSYKEDQKENDEKNQQTDKLPNQTDDIFFKVDNSNGQLESKAIAETNKKQHDSQRDQISERDTQDF